MIELQIRFMNKILIRILIINLFCFTFFQEDALVQRPSLILIFDIRQKDMNISQEEAAVKLQVLSSQSIL